MEEYNIVIKTINIPKSLNTQFKNRAKTNKVVDKVRLAYIAIDYFLTLPEAKQKEILQEYLLI